MAKVQDSYAFISEKIRNMKEAFPTLRNKPDSYVFSVLCVKSNFYKNPALILNESDFEDMIVDGQYDGGIDFLLSDPNSEGSDLIIGQSKFYGNIQSEDVQNAMIKMALFYKDMERGRYEQVNEKVQSRFIILDSDIGEESKIHFVFYTSAPQKGIRRDSIEKRFREQLQGYENIEVSILFADDIVEAIKESESRRPTVESGKIHIDDKDNCLFYGDEAIVVNVSAFSIKKLYAEHNINLLARNLRYHVPGRDIDKAIRETINNDPNSFWLKNNGITIVCTDFKVDGKEVKLKDFSIVNGGQTTFMLSRSAIDETNDFYLLCKIIKVTGNTEDERNSFILSIAKATNSQKPIKLVDLKANAPEQIRFARAMREVGIFYQTKRGENVPSQYKARHLNTDLVEIGKLCLAGIFQAPCLSRTKPSSLYQEKYYEPIFCGNQSQIAGLCKELLYIDSFFRTKYQQDINRGNVGTFRETKVRFANNSRTICIAFVAFAARYRQGNLTDQDISPIFDRNLSESTFDTLYKTFRELDQLNSLLPSVHGNMEQYDSTLRELFSTIIEAGTNVYSWECEHDQTLTETNYLKKDKNYYSILKNQWNWIESRINEIFSKIGM